MKIALFSGAGSVPCAASAYVSVLRSGLEKTGNEVMVVTADPEIEECFPQNGTIYCPARPTPSLYGCSVRTSLLGPMEEDLARFRPDVIHVVTLDEMGLAGVKFAQNYDRPLVTTIHNLHDALEGYGLNKAYDSLAKMKVRSTVRKILSESDAILAPSSKTADELKAIDIRCKLKRSPFCVDLDTFVPSDTAHTELLDEWKIPKTTTNYIFAGRLLDDCGVAALLEDWHAAVAPTDPLHLIIAGTGPDAALYAEHAKTLQLSEQVTFVGQLSKQKLTDLYSCCRAFVSASRSGAIKAAPLEAMAAGLPVLLHEDSANAELVRDGVNGFLFRDAQRLGEILRQLETLDQEGIHLLHTLVRKSAQNLSDVNLAEGMLDTYAVAAKRRKAHRSAQ